MSERAEKTLRYFREQADFVDAHVKAGIELYRKGTAALKVVDAEGNPVKGATIEAKETKQAFKFGANLFMIDQMETPEKNLLYKQKFADIFNLGTVPFYWIDLEPEQGKPRFAVDSPYIYRRPPTDACVNYCHDYGLEPKLHCLNYNPFTPEWLKGKPTAYVKKMLLKRFEEIAERYADSIPMIEVTNETFCRNAFNTHFFLEDDFVSWSFRQAERIFPYNKLVINEAGIEWDASNANTNRNPYYLQVKSLLDEHVPVQGVGMQFHSFTSQDVERNQLASPTGRYCPSYLCSVMDKMAELNLPMQITEMTIPAFSKDEEDEDIQAEILKNVYSLFFAQRNMEAIIYWNLVDGYAYRAVPGDMTAGENIYHGALVRFDMSEKPAYKTLQKLIKHDWMTDTSVTTDENGYALLRGFHGDYDLTIHAGEKSTSHTLTLEGSEIREFNLTI